MTALELFTTLRQCGVVLVPMVDRVRVDAPKGVLTPALRQQLTQHKAALHDLVEAFEERAGIAQYCGGLAREDAERLAWQCLVPEESSHASHATDGQRQPMKVYHRSQSTEWETPQAFFDDLNVEFGFTLDVAAQPTNAKCPHYYTPEVDGLVQPWTGVCWMNPPYGPTIGAWMKKAHESALQGATVVCLVPARTDTKWWHTYTTQGDIRFLKGRLTFGNAKHPAPFPSAVVIFRPRACPAEGVQMSAW